MVELIRVVVFIFVQIVLQFLILQAPKGKATYLSDYYNLKCTMPKAPGKLGKKGHRRIYISATSILLVQSLVKNFMVPSMLYKIGL